MCTLQAVLDTIIGKIVERVIQSVALRVGFLFQYKKNLKTLEAEITNLEEQIEKIKLKVNEALTCGEEVDDLVSKWQDMVGKTVEEFKDYKTVNDNMQCFKFSCPDYISRYRTSKEVVKKIGEVKNLTHSGNFSTVAHPKPPPEELQFLSSANYASFESRESVFNSIMEAVQDSNVKIVGVYGIGGVGKTTMVEEVGNQVKKNGLFDEVVVAVVSQDVNVSKIQGQLADRLGLNLNAANEVEGKAIQLWNRLNNGKKNLIILDDIWQKLDLKKMGIPITDENKYCKVVITSRIRSVLENMQVDKIFSIQVLSEKEAWALFKKKVGDSVDSSHLRDTADAVCKECGGLPIAILAVGAALTYKDMYAWKDALNQLKNSNLKNIEEIDPKVYSSLKFSYDWLQSEDAKLCFLLCCLFPEDDEISIDDLVRQCIARRLLDDMDTLETTRNRVLTVVKTLKTSCLLIEGNDENIVKMHDVIRDVAISIAKGDKAFLVKHGVQEWPKKGTYESSSAISLRSKFIREVPNELGCPQLHTLLLECSENTSVIVPNMFFSGMEKLIILCLGQIHMLQLPTSLAKLVNLRMLCLNECQLEDVAILKDLKKTLEILSLRGSDIEVLPLEIGQLTHLRLLDLRDCEKLTEIPQGVISNLSLLEELYILNSFEQWEVTTTNKKGSNASLDELSKLKRLTTLHIHIPNVMLLPKDLYYCFDKLIRFCILVGYVSMDKQNIPYEKYSRVFGVTGVSLVDQFNVLLERAELLNLKEVEDFQEVHHYRGGEGFLMQHHGLNTSRSFNKLTVLSINDCRLKYLFSPSCARGILQLQQLEIRNCEIMEEIVGIEEKKDEEGLMSQVINFSQLKHMMLDNLPNLLSFCLKMGKTTSEENSSTQAQSLFNEKVTFPALEELYIHVLPMITEIWDLKLLQSKSFCQLRKVDICECENLVNAISANMLQRSEIVEDNDNVISFPQLRRLNLKNLQSFKCFCSSRFEAQSLFNNQVAFPILEELYINCLPNIIEIWSKQSLITLEKESKSFCQLKNLHVSYCPKLEVMVSKKDEEKGPTNDDIIVFPQLKTLYLFNLMNLKSFYSWPTRSEAQTLFNHQVAFPVLDRLDIRGMSNIIKIWDKQLLITSIKESTSFYQLKELHVADCPKLEAIVMEKGEAKEPTNDDIIMFSQLTFLYLFDLMNLKSFYSWPTRSEAQTLFNDRVAFPVLDKLYISGMSNIIKIWDKQLLITSMKESKSFYRLKRLRVHRCPMLEAIVIDKEEEKGPTNDHVIVFSQLKTLDFFDLLNLKSFYSWPTRFEAQTLFNDQVAFPVLDNLKISVMPNIIKIWDKQLLITAIKESKSFYQLKELEVFDCPKLEVIVLEKEEKGPTNDDIIVFLQLTTLNLFDLMNLKSFYSWPTRSEAQTLFNDQVAFPVLEHLGIRGIPNIIKIWDKQLLITSIKESKSFYQLKGLQVSNCPMLEAVVIDKEEEKGPTNDDIIVFSQLTTLHLSNLMNLKSFCSWPTRSKAQTLFNDQVSFPVLKELDITHMPDIIKIWDKQLLITSIKESKSFYKLKELLVSNCPKLKAIVMEKEEPKGPTNDDIIVFSQLTTLKLYNLMNLKSFCSWPTRSEAQTLFNDQVAFPKLEHLFLGKCVNSSEIHPWNVLAGKISLNALEVYNCKQVSTVASPHLVQRLQNIHTLIVRDCSEVTQVFQLEGLNVGEGRHVRPLTEVRRMELDGLPQLTCLWNKDPLGILGLQSLQYLTIKKCSLLRNLFTRSTAMALEQLKVLYLKSCPMMEEVIATDEGHKEVTGDEIEFPKLEWLILKDLPNLNSFCNANYNCNLPSLQRVVLKRCPKMQTFTSGQVHMSQVLLSTRGDEGLHIKDLNGYLEQRLLKGEECATIDENDYTGEEEEFSNLYFL